MKKRSNIHGIRMFQRDLSPAHGAGDEERPRLDAVRNGRIRRPVQLFHPLHHNDGAPRAADLPAHAVDKVLQVDDLRLLRRVADDRRPLRLGGGEDDVLRRPDAGEVQQHFRAAQPPARTVYVPAVLRDVDAQPPQPAQMQVDGPQPDVAPAGVRDARPAEARNDRPQHKDGGAQLLCQRRGDLVVGGVGTVNAHRIPFKMCFAAELAEDADHVQHVGNARDTYGSPPARLSERRRRAGAARRSFADWISDLSAAEPPAAFDDKFIHVFLLSQTARRARPLVQTAAPCPLSFPASVSPPTPIIRRNA